MAGVVFAAVLGAAVLHASWNAIAKAVPDQRVAASLLSMAGLVAGGVGAVALPLSGQPLAYAMWLSLLQGPLVIAASRVMYGARLWRVAARSAPLGLLGGVLALAAYAIVLWAQSRAPLPLVSALRETSLLFAGLIGTLVFGERFSPTRVAATVAAVAGIALLQVA